MDAEAYLRVVGRGRLGTWETGVGPVCQKPRLIEPPFPQDVKEPPDSSLSSNCKEGEGGG